MNGLNLQFKEIRIIMLCNVGTYLFMFISIIIGKSQKYQIIQKFVLIKECPVAIQTSIK